MLTRILILTLLLLSTHNIFSQDEHGIPYFPKLGVWSVSYLGGSIINTEGNPGYTISMETAYRESLSTEMFLNFSFSKLHVNRTTGYKLMECSIGPRFYFLKNKALFAEAAFGLQLNFKKREYRQWDYGFTGVVSKTHSALYVSAGLGYTFHVSEATDLQLQFKYGTTLSKTDGVSHFGLQAGITSNVLKTTLKGKNPKGSFSFAAGTGMLNQNDLNGNIYSGKSLISFETMYRLSPLKEISVETGYFSYTINYQPEQYNNIFLNAGPRYYFNSSSLPLFMEFGGGLILQLGSHERPANKHFQPGLYGGAGIVSRFSEKFSLFIKGKLNFVISENIYSPHYSSLTAGARINF